VVIHDDEHYFMGGALAERLARAGHQVALVTPHATASYWTALTDEQGFVQARLLELGVALHLSQHVTGQGADAVQLACAYTGRVSELACGTLVLVTGRLPEDALWRDVQGQHGSVTRLGDCLAPSTIADAVYAGHSYARGLGEAVLPLRREMPR
jgi:dimethylamine/trimethylamine dehydrogenase